MAVKKNKKFRYRRLKNRQTMNQALILLAGTISRMEWGWYGNCLRAEPREMPLEFCPITALHYAATGEIYEYRHAYRVIPAVMAGFKLKRRTVLRMLAAACGKGSKSLQDRIAVAVGLPIDPESFSPSRGSTKESRLFIFK